MSLRCAVGGNDTVAVEGIVGGIVVVVVAAIEERHLSVALVTSYALVYKVPNETSLVLAVGACQVPILLKSAHRVAHSVGIFALYEGS